MQANSVRSLRTSPELRNLLSVHFHRSRSKQLGLTLGASVKYAGEIGGPYALSASMKDAVLVRPVQCYSVRKAACKFGTQP